MKKSILILLSLLLLGVGVVSVEGITITYGNDGDSCSSDTDCMDYGYSCDTSQRKCVTSCNDRTDDDGDGGIDTFGACYAGGVYWSCSQIGIDSTDYSSLDDYREACYEECEPQLHAFGSTVSATYVEYDSKCNWDPYGAGSESACSTDEDCPWYTTCDGSTCLAAGSENGNTRNVESCRDGLDADHDGDTDCEDSDCDSVCCTTDSDCASDAACLITDLDPSATEDIVGNCVVCEDSDGGYDLSVKGTIDEAVWWNNGDYYEDMADKCNGVKIWEYSCKDPADITKSGAVGSSGHLYAYYDEVSCPTGYTCKSGVCAKSTITTTSKVKTTIPRKSSAPEEDMGFWERFWVWFTEV